MVLPLIALLLHMPSSVMARLPVPPIPIVTEAPAPVAADRARFDTLMTFAQTEQLATLPLGEAAVALGQQMIGTPYVAGVLDAQTEETLIAPLDRFDCVLFVETTLALARGVQAHDATYEGYLRRIEQQRYRTGALAGYGSRLHYFSDWIADGAARGLVENVTASIGGEPYLKALNFMTTHRASYPQLTDDGRFAEIMNAEATLAGKPRVYVPKARVESVYGALQTGDILATTTDLAGLDVTHTGFAVVTPDGRVGFLHASPGHGVTFAPDLARYLARNPRQTGLIVARPR